MAAALADLPADEREEMLDDLRSHLAEVADESDTPPTTRLGPPEEYAAELRVAAGIGPAPRAVDVRAASSLERLRDAGTAVRDWVRRRPGGPGLLAFLPQLRPAWWVLRGYLLALVGAVVLGAVDFAGPLPADGSTALVFLVFAAGLAVASVWLGTHPPRRPAAVLALRVGGVLLVLLGFAAWRAASTGTVYAVSDEGPLTRITDVQAYDAEGRPLRDVQLFDQDGNPVELYDACGNPASRLREDGTTALNVYPRGVPGGEDASCGDPSRPAPARLPALVPRGPSAAAPSTDPAATPSATPAGPSATPAGPTASASPGSSSPVPTPATPTPTP